MRRQKLLWLAVALGILAGLLAGCARTKAPVPEPVQPFSFYYRTAQTSYGDEHGLISPEIKDLGENPATEEDIFQRYWEGPSDQGLLSPLPGGVKFLGAAKRSALLTIRLSPEYAELSAIDASVADACLAMTAFGIEGVEQVRILCEGDQGQTLRSVLLEPSDILLFDTGNEPGNTELTLYFADSTGSFLLADRRTVPYMEAPSLPQYVLEQLIAGPQAAGLYPTMPQGTVLLDVNVENGICSVDFNGDFWENRPLTQRGEQLTLLSVVNTLCALDEVDEVEFYIEGRKPGLYTYLSLAGPFRADLGVVGPIRSELNEFEAVLYLPDADQALLHSLPLRVRAGSGLSREEALLRALWDRPTHNGMMNPVENALPPRSVNVEGGVCTIDFPDRSFLGQDAATELSAVRTITATMCSLDTVDRVRFTVNGQDAALTYNDLSFPLAANRLWMLR